VGLRFFPILGIHVFMNEQDTIKEAYADALKSLYNALREAFITAQDQRAQDQAKQRFSSGLALARKARDAALALL
jgi:hypothetical protein